MLRISFAATMASVSMIVGAGCAVPIEGSESTTDPDGTSADTGDGVLDGEASSHVMHLGYTLFECDTSQVPTSVDAAPISSLVSLVFQDVTRESLSELDFRVSHLRQYDGCSTRGAYTQLVRTDGEVIEVEASLFECSPTESDDFNERPGSGPPFFGSLVIDPLIEAVLDMLQVDAEAEYFAVPAEETSFDTCTRIEDFEI